MTRAPNESDRAPLPPSLAAGYARFRAEVFPAERDRYRDLDRHGQEPSAVVIACSDSRADPITVFDAHPGEVFVVRNVGALVPVYAPDAKSHSASAALEYGVLALQVRSIIVMGHSGCGGIRAAASPAIPLSTTDFIGSWVAGVRVIADEIDRLIARGAPLDSDGRLQAIERLSVERSVDNLRTFPWIAAAEASGALALHGMWFDVGRAELHAAGPRGWEPLGRD